MSATRIIAVVKSEARFGPEGMSLWRLTGVLPGRTPAWFRKIVDSDYDGQFHRDWLDHFAKDGDSLLVEPYDLDGESARDLLAFAERHSLRVTISAISHHFPTRTLAIHLTPRDRSAQ
jgi:hypothetical protein